LRRYSTIVSAEFRGIIGSAMIGTATDSTMEERNDGA